MKIESSDFDAIYIEKDSKDHNPSLSNLFGFSQPKQNRRFSANLWSEVQISEVNPIIDSGMYLTHSMFIETLKPTSIHQQKTWLPHCLDLFLTRASTTQQVLSNYCGKFLLQAGQLWNIKDALYSIS